MSIATTIRNGELSVPLCANYNSVKSLFGGALAAPNSPVLIAMVTDALAEMESDATYTEQQKILVANYLIFLMGKFGLEASVITGSGGSVSPVPAGGLSGSRIDFYVAAGAFIEPGESSKTITQFIGKDIEYYRGGVWQTSLNTEPTYFTWVKSSGLFTIYGDAVDGEQMSIVPV